MIDPFNITNYDYTDAQLQEFLLAAIAVAGKTAKVIFPKIHQLVWESEYTAETPFKTLINMDYNIDAELKRVAIGKYNVLNNAFYCLPRYVENQELDLRTCTPQQLEQFYGVGSKTSRYFILHSRPNQQYAVLDRHILKWLGEKGYDVPKSTPSGKNYSRLENDFLAEARKSGKSVADLDLEIWKSYAKQ